MPYDILTEEEHKDTIRDVLGVTERDLPDSVLDSIMGIQAGELKAKERVITWSAIMTADDEDTIRLKIGTIYLTAIAVLPRLRMMLREFEKIGEFTLGRMDWDKFKQDLMDSANVALGSIGTDSDLDYASFVVTGPSRRFRDLVEAGQWGQTIFRNV